MMEVNLTLSCEEEEEDDDEEEEEEEFRTISIYYKRIIHIHTSININKGKSEDY